MPECVKCRVAYLMHDAVAAGFGVTAQNLYIEYISYLRSYGYNTIHSE